LDFCCQIERLWHDAARSDNHRSSAAKGQSGRTDEVIKWTLRNATIVGGKTALSDNGVTSQCGKTTSLFIVGRTVKYVTDRQSEA